MDHRWFTKYQDRGGGMKTFQQIRMVDLATVARLFLLIGATLMTLVSLPGCGGNPPSTPTISYNLSTSVSPSGGGSVSPSNGTYLSGASVTLTATPASGYQFVSWSGDASGTNLTATITMNSNKNVIATFEQVARVNNLELPSRYYIALPSSRTYLQGGQTVTLSWSANGTLEGYIFTETQFNNFKQYGSPSGYEAYRAGKNETISAYVHKSDIYYGVITNRLIVNPTVKLYEATLTLR